MVTLLGSAEFEGPERNALVAFSLEKTFIVVASDLVSFRTVMEEQVSLPEASKEQLFVQLETCGLPETGGTMLRVEGRSAVVLAMVLSCADTVVLEDDGGESGLEIITCYGANDGIDSVCLSYVDRTAVAHFHMIHTCYAAAVLIKGLTCLDMDTRLVLLQAIDGYRLPRTSEIEDVHLVGFAARIITACLLAEEDRREAEERANNPDDLSS